MTETTTTDLNVAAAEALGWKWKGHQLVKMNDGSIAWSRDGEDWESVEFATSIADAMDLLWHLYLSSGRVWLFGVHHYFVQIHSLHGPCINEESHSQESQPAAITKAFLRAVKATDDPQTVDMQYG